MALVVGRYECLFTRKSHISRGQSTQSIFIKTNLTFYSICVVVYVDGYITVIQKMRIETKHSTTREIFFYVHLYGVVCCPN